MYKSKKVETKITIRYGKVLALSTNIFFSARGRLGGKFKFKLETAIIKYSGLI